MEIIVLPRDLVRVVTLRDMTRSMTAPLVSNIIMMLTSVIMVRPKAFMK